MSYFVIIRGPAGIGKTAVAKELAKRLNGYYISFDEVMRKHKLDTIKGGGISAENFIKANNLVIPRAKKELENDKIVVFDGCFYRREQLEHLEKNIPYKYYVFSLKAPLERCILRNKSRPRAIAKQSIKAVHQLVSRIDIGIDIETSGKTISEVADEIQSHLPA